MSTLVPKFLLLWQKEIGLSLSQFYGSFKKPTVEILMVGLESSGITTILDKLKTKEEHTLPTIGFRVQTVECKNIAFTIFEFGFNEKIRPLCNHYLQKSSGIILVIDSSDRDLVSEAVRKMCGLLLQDEVNIKFLLVLANKQDLSKGMSALEIKNALGLTQFKSLTWHIQAISATQSQGLYEGFEWLAQQIRKC